MAGRGKRFLPALLLLLAPAARGQGVPYQLNPPAPNAQVQFCPVPDGGYPCPSPLTVYSNSAATQVVAQPISVGSGGNLSVYFAAGTSSWTVQLLGQGYGPQNRYVVAGGSSSVSSPAPTIQGGLSSFRSTLTKIAKMQTASPAQLRVLVWGDSVAGFHNNAVAAGLRDSFGNAGVDISCQGTIATGQGGSCVTNDALSGGAFVIDGSVHAYDYTRSPTGVYYSIPAGGCALFGLGGGYAVANQLSLLYVSEPGAGSLQFQTNKNGAGFVTQSTTSAANASTIGSVVTYTAPDTGPYKIQACATGATVNVFGPTFENSLINGVVIINVSRGGLALNNANSTPSAVTAPWFAALAPDLILFEMKTNGANNANCLFASDSSSWPSNLTIFASNWTTANSLVDFLFFGTSPVISPNDACQVVWNTGTRSVALANNAIYFDGYYPNLNYATEKALGWITDISSPHQTTLGQAAEANLLWQQLGFNDFINGASPRMGGVNAPTSTLTSLTLSTDIAGLNPPGGKILAIDGFDLYAKPTRSWQFQDLAGNAFGNLASTKTSYGQATNYMPPFQTSIFSNETGAKGPWIAELDANTVGIFQNPGSQAPNNLFLKRLRVNGTAYSGADAAIVPTSGWGTGPAVSAAAGFDQAFSWSVTCGTTPAPNPVITVTFKDGTWTQTPQYMVSRNDIVAPTPATFFPTWVEAATTLTITMQGTCTAGNVYKFKAMAMGN